MDASPLAVTLWIWAVVCLLRFGMSLVEFGPLKGRALLGVDCGGGVNRWEWRRGSGWFEIGGCGLSLGVLGMLCEKISRWGVSGWVVHRS